MPKSETMFRVTNITYSGSSVLNWEAIIETISGVQLGKYTANVGAFTQLATLASSDAEEVLMRITPTSAITFDLADTDTFSISYDGYKTMTAYLSAYTGTDEIVLYIDTNGVLFNDTSLEDSFSLGNTLTENMSAGETFNPELYESSDEVLLLIDENRFDSYTETEELILLKERTEPGKIFETTDIINFKEDYYEESFVEQTEDISLTDTGSVLSIFFDEEISLGESTYSTPLGDEGYAQIVTDVLPFSERGLKNLTWIEVQTEHSSSLQVAVDVVYSPGDTWKRTALKKVNKESTVRVNVTGTEFRLILKVDDKTTFKLGSIRVGFQMVDRRYTRGAQIIEVN